MGQTKVTGRANVTGRAGDHAPKLLGISRPGVGDVFTLLNAACGLGAVLYVVAHARGLTPASAGEALKPAVLLLVAGTFFDVVDGLAARRFGCSALGRPLDAMADTVTFGVAPAVLLGAPLLGSAGPVAWFVALIGVVAYLCGAVLRLANFAAESERPTHFTGLPSPLAALCAMALLMLGAGPVTAGLGMVGIGVMMISPVRYPLQGGVVGALAIGGWGAGALALVGVVDPTAPSIVVLVIIVVLVPSLRALIPGAEPDRGAFPAPLAGAAAVRRDPVE